MIKMGLVIPLEGAELLSPNTRRRMHWAAQARITKEQRELACYSSRTAQPIELRHRDVHLTLVRGKGQRLVDLDALGSICKPFLDGIVDAGWLHNDSPKWCTPHYDQIRGERAELRVRVEQA